MRSRSMEQYLCCLIYLFIFYVIFNKIHLHNSLSKEISYFLQFSFNSLRMSHYEQNKEVFFLINISDYFKVLVEGKKATMMILIK